MYFGLLETRSIRRHALHGIGRRGSVGNGNLFPLILGSFDAFPISGETLVQLIDGFVDRPISLL